MSFTSICNACSIIVQTSTNQITNTNFTCSKECNIQLRIKKEKQKYDDKYGPKLISSHSFKNNVRCDKCHDRFYSDTVPEYCDKCIDNIPIQLQCIKCTTTFKQSPKKARIKNNMCTDCFNNIETLFVCTMCNMNYTDTHNSYNKLNIAICKLCQKK